MSKVPDPPLFSYPLLLWQKAHNCCHVLLAFPLHLPRSCHGLSPHTPTRSRCLRASLRMMWSGGNHKATSYINYFTLFFTFTSLYPRSSTVAYSVCLHAVLPEGEQVFGVWTQGDSGWEMTVLGLFVLACKVMQTGPTERRSRGWKQIAQALPPPTPSLDQDIFGCGDAAPTINDLFKRGLYCRNLNWKEDWNEQIENKQEGGTTRHNRKLEGKYSDVHMMKL